MADIFVSYDSEDRPRVAPVVEALERQGWSVWWDRNIPPGENFDEVIEAEIDAARCVVVIWTSSSVNSQWVRSEALEGLERNVLVPVRLEEVRPPFAFRRIQAADLAGWTSGTSHAQYGSFVESVASVLGRSPVANLVPIVDRPSVAVMPFSSMSSDPDDEYLADGMTEDVITLLSRNYDMLVMGRNTSFAYKGKALDARQLGVELGVAYVLEGSVRRHLENVRVSAQLVETETGTQVWAERYDRPGSALFELQDELIGQVASSVNANVFDREIALASDLSRPSRSVWQLNKRLETEWMRAGPFTDDHQREAIERIDAAIRSSPDNVVLLAHKARVIAASTSNLLDVDRESGTQLASALASEAIERSPQDAEVLAIAGAAFTVCGRYDEGVRACEQAFARDPLSSQAAAYLAYALITSGNDVERGAELLDELLRRDPFTPLRGACLFWRGMAHSISRDPEAAVESLRESIRVQPRYPFAWLDLALNLVRLKQLDEARSAVEELVRLLPGLKLETILGSLRHVSNERVAQIYERALKPIWIDS